MATATEFHIRAAMSADTDRILDLVRVSLGEGTIPRERAYWEWKHHQNPFGESPMLVAEAAGVLVGLRVFMRWNWSAGGRVLHAVRAVDTATHPEWQGRRIFSTLTLRLVQQMAEQGVHFIFNTPNEKSRPGYLKMGWRAAGRTDVWIRPLRPARVARALLSRDIRPEHGQAAEAFDVPAFDGIEAFCNTVELPAFLASVARGSGPLRLSSVRTVDYLRWRYQQIPGFRYDAIFQLDGDDGAAVVFRHKQQGALVELRICELLIAPTPRSSKLARRLLARLLNESRADYVSAMASAGTAQRSTLLRRGFLPAFRMGPLLAVRPLNEMPAGLDLMSRSDWQLSIGDLELF